MKNSITEINPYIHGTSSATLSLLAKLDFQFMSILDMMEKYHLAPLTGELTQGGYNCISFIYNGNEMIGCPAFGRMENSSYSFSRVVKDYTGFKPDLKEDILQHFLVSFENSDDNKFSDINLLLIYLCRAIELDIPIPISVEQLINFKEKYNKVLNYFYFLQWFGINFKINERISNHSQDTISTVREITLNLTFQNIIDTIQTLNIDIKELIESANKKDNQRLKSKLGLDMLIENKFLAEKTSVDVQNTLLDEVQQYHLFKGILTRQNFGHTLLGELYRSLTRHDFFSELALYIPDYINNLKKRMAIFDNLSLVKEPAPKIDLNDPLNQKSFPLVFFTLNQNLTPFGSEHRALSPLKLGQDISVLATDTPEHCKEVLNFLAKHQLDFIQVYLMKTIEKEYKKIHYMNVEHFKMILDKTKDLEQQPLFEQLYTSLKQLSFYANLQRIKDPLIASELDDLLFMFNQQIQMNFSEGNLDISAFCQRCQEVLVAKKAIFEENRGLIRIIDTLLTVSLSLLIFYPFVYHYQKKHGYHSSFFSSETGLKTRKLYCQLEEIKQMTKI